MIRIKRVFEPLEKEDGFRVLVDRLWPRGVKKEEAQLDEWAKEITPSRELREDFHHGMSGGDFHHYYREELLHNDEFSTWKNKILLHEKEGNVTLLTAAKLLPGNHVEVLKQLLEE